MLHAGRIFADTARAADKLRSSAAARLARSNRVAIEVAQARQEQRRYAKEVLTVIERLEEQARQAAQVSPQTNQSLRSAEAQRPGADLIVRIAQRVGANLLDAAVEQADSLVHAAVLEANEIVEAAQKDSERVRAEAQLAAGRIAEQARSQIAANGAANSFAALWRAASAPEDELADFFSAIPARTEAEMFLR